MGDDDSDKEDAHDRLETRLVDLAPWFSEDLKTLASDPPTVMYHYTSPEALLGMLQSSTIWATNAAFLNDRTELTYVDEVIASVAESLHGAAQTDCSRELLRVLQLSDWRGYEPRDVFVACFSENADSLSQWRAYANDGSGYSVGVGTDSRFRVRGRPERTALLLRVLYDEAEQRAAVRRPLARILEAIDACEGREDLAYVRFRGLVAVAQSVVPVGFALKNPGFAEEADRRLVVVDEAPWPQGPHLRHRPSEFGLTPFVELEVAERIPLRSVTLGPRLHEDPARRGLVSGLLKNGYKIAGTEADRVDISDSRTSYRGRPHHA